MSGFPPDVVKRWEKLYAKLTGLPVMDQAREVNRFFNQWPYRTDIVVYGLNEYWATPLEFAKNSGDCEDYAISKYYALRALGVPKDKLRIVAVKDTIKNIGHAVLAVYIGETAFILDNLSMIPLEHTRLTHYKPQFSVNEEYRWGHARIVKK